MVNQKLARGMVSQPLFENFQKPEIFTRGSNWSVLLLPKVPISDPWGEVFKTKCFQSFSSCQIETCMIYILALDLSSGKISDFCFLWIKTYVQSNNCLIKTAIFQKLSKLRPNFFLSCFFRICACFVLNLSRELQTKDF